MGHTDCIKCGAPISSGSRHKNASRPRKVCLSCRTKKPVEHTTAAPPPPLLLPPASAEQPASPPSPAPADPLLKQWSKFPDGWDIRSIEGQTAEEMIAKQRNPDSTRIRLAIFRKQICAFFNKVPEVDENDWVDPLPVYEGTLPCNIRLAREPTRAEVKLLNQELGVRGLTILNDRYFEREHSGTPEEERKILYSKPYPVSNIVVGCPAQRIGQSICPGGFPPGA
jgi:hypothetical protein